jgi:hypothetical protein
MQLNCKPLTVNHAVLCIVFCLCLPGCAATNAIHNSRFEFYVQDLIDVGEMRMVEAASFDRDSRFLYLCMYGNFRDESLLGDRLYTLVIEPGMMQAEKNRVPYTVLQEGCDFSKRQDLQPLRLAEVTEKNEGEYPRWHEPGADGQVPVVSGYVESVRFIYGGSKAFPKLEVNVSNGGRYRNDADRLEVSLRKGEAVLGYNGRLALGSIANDWPPYDQHRYEIVGNLIDILTGIIQVPVCLVTGLHGCSLEPHPEL